VTLALEVDEGAVVVAVLGDSGAILAVDAVDEVAEVKVTVAATGAEGVEFVLGVSKEAGASVSCGNHSTFTRLLIFWYSSLMTKAISSADLKVLQFTLMTGMKWEISSKNCSYPS